MDAAPRLLAAAPAPARGPRRPGRPRGGQKGGLRAEVDAVAAAHPGAAATVWATDEHRLGLLPAARRVWAPRGRRPTAWARRRYERLDAYGVVRPATGQTWWRLPPTVGTEAFALALREFARDEGLGPAKRAVLALDRAGWHASPDLALPEGLHLAFLPPASPELQPAARRWGPVDEPVANRAPADVDEPEAVPIARCRALEADRRTVKAHTRFPWWPRERRRRRQP